MLVDLQTSKLVYSQSPTKTCSCGRMITCLRQVFNSWLQVLSNALKKKYVLTACKDGRLWVRKSKVSSGGQKSSHINTDLAFTCL